MHRCAERVLEADQAPRILKLPCHGELPESRRRGSQEWARNTHSQAAEPTQRSDLCRRMGIREKFGTHCRAPGNEQIRPFRALEPERTSDGDDDAAAAEDDARPTRDDLARYAQACRLARPTHLPKSLAPSKLSRLVAAQGKTYPDFRRQRCAVMRIYPCVRTHLASANYEGFQALRRMTRHSG